MKAFDAEAFQALRRGAWGSELRRFDRLASTQDAAREAARGGATAGCVVLAEEQSAGRGRWGRRWEAPAGSSLLFTLLLERGAARPGALPLALGLGALRALRGLGLGEAGLKWPNDLLWRGLKLGGLLVEQAGEGLLVGCGLNVTQAPGDFPPELRGRAASLAQTGLDCGREALLAALLQAWEEVLVRLGPGDLGPLLPELLASDALLGRPCRVLSGGRELSGLCLGPDAEGALGLRLESGQELRLHSAEAVELRPLAVP